MFYHLQERYTRGNTPRGPGVSKEEADYAKCLAELLPEGIALINIWDLAINKTVLHFLSGLIGHLYNSHMWLFLDIERDLHDLDQPPLLRAQEHPSKVVGAQHSSEINQPEGAASSALMKWRPRLHYLLRAARLSQGTSYDKESRDARESPCTIFTKYSSLKENAIKKEEIIKGKVKELKEKIRKSAKHIGVSSLIDPKIETINLNGVGITDDHSLRLYQKFQQVICETPYKEVPVAWVFLRCSLYYNDSMIISKRKLIDMARECGMNESSLDEFSKFYTSFGSIFDLSLVDPSYEYTIVKPIEFLRKLDAILDCEDSLIESHPILKYGIVSEEACKEVFQDQWREYMDALVVVHLAARITSARIDMPNLDRSKIYYFVPLSRGGDLVTAADTDALHVITSISKTHLFKQAFLVAHLLKFFPNAKLLCCTESNQTKLRDDPSGVVITLVHHSPTTKIHISRPDRNVCSLIIQACQNIAATSKIAGTTAYNFIIPCAKSQLASAQTIASCQYHILPMDITQCSECEKRAGHEQFEVWNEAIREVSLLVRIQLCHFLFQHYGPTVEPDNSE